VSFPLLFFTGPALSIPGGLEDLEGKVLSKTPRTEQEASHGKGVVVASPALRSCPDRRQVAGYQHRSCQLPQSPGKLRAVDLSHLEACLGVPDVRIPVWMRRRCHQGLASCGAQLYKLVAIRTLPVTAHYAGRNVPPV